MAIPGPLFFLAFAASLVVSLATLPPWRAWCQRSGLVDDPGHRKIHHTPIALAGGLAVMTGLVIPLLGAALVLHLQWLSPDTVEKLTYGLGKRADQLLVILVSAFAMLYLGWLDDKYELKPAAKFGGQMLIALATAAAGIRITLFVDSLLFSYAITVLWILTVTNAVNFMDNMNGLCAGLTAICAGWIALIAIQHGQYLVALIAVLMAGAFAGFLPYNYPHASAFLGDAGSHLAGYSLAVLAILPHFYSRSHPHIWAVFSPLLILAVPLGDLVWVVILRWRKGQPFYVGDTNHLSHRMVRRGYSKAGAVLRIWILAALAGGLAWGLNRW